MHKICIHFFNKLKNRSKGLLIWYVIIFKGENKDLLGTQILSFLIYMHLDVCMTNGCIMIQGLLGYFFRIKFRITFIRSFPVSVFDKVIDWTMCNWLPYTYYFLNMTLNDQSFQRLIICISCINFTHFLFFSFLDCLLSPIWLGVVSFYSYYLWFAKNIEFDAKWILLLFLHVTIIRFLTKHYIRNQLENIA